MTKPYMDIIMNKCDTCKRVCDNVINGMCVDCLADKWGDIVEAPIKRNNMIKFIDLRDSDVEYNFAFFNIRTHKFVTVSDRVAWYSFDDLGAGIRDECNDMYSDTGVVMRSYAKLCPEWVFE